MDVGPLDNERLQECGMFHAETVLYTLTRKGDKIAQGTKAIHAISMEAAMYGVSALNREDWVSILLTN